VLLAVIVTLAAATTTATRWTWTPLSSCLFCGAPSGDLAAPSIQSRGAAPSATLTGRLRHSVALEPLDVAPMPVGASASDAHGRSDKGESESRSDRDWQPWGTSSAFRSAGGDGSSAALGGLSRLVAMSISGGGYAVRATAATTSTAATVASAAVVPAPAVSNPPTPPAAPSPTPPTAHDPAPPSSTSAVVPTLAPIPAAPGAFTLPVPPAASAHVTVPAPLDSFHEHNTPPPTPFVPAAPAGTLSSNDPPGITVSDAAPSATPEPASMLLLATGLIAVAGELRRRGVV
jgi:PEP-CTERM motif